MEYLDQLHNQYLNDPESVDPQWKYFFEGMKFAQSSDGGSLSSKELDVYKLIRTYRDYGHLKANLDPLKLAHQDLSPFALSRFGLSEADLNQKFQAGSLINLPNATLKQIIEVLENTYCGTLSVQIAECAPEVRRWFQMEMEEQAPNFKLNNDDKKRIFEQLARTESLEKFIHTRYVGTKRFSVEGGDSVIPMLEHLVHKGSSLGVEEVVIGMAHRGRINVLANFMGKALDFIFAEFEGSTFDEKNFEGDVKYHIGFSADKQTPHGSCHISLAFNPSHLEAVNPVVLGMTRAKQRIRKNTDLRNKVVPVQIHGDAAFSGQGVVFETLQLSQLKGYTVGGAIHLIINNQVGFTTNPQDSRSTTYSSDTAKSIKAPVIFVNGDDVEACVRAMDMAIRFRQEFKQDVVIDLICYRRFGHNEGDEPAFTQPVMYNVIKNHPTTMAIYQEKLVSSNALDAQYMNDFFQQKIDNLQKILDEVRANPPKLSIDTFGGIWKGLRRGTAEDFEIAVNTQVSDEDIRKVCQVLTTEPEGVKLNSKIKRLIENRRKMIDEDQIDWGLAELLSYGSLIAEGHSVRLSGQDCKRGTFTHRHSVYFDANTGEEYTPLKNLNPDKEFCVYNSSLSEMAVLGFEYGNSSSDPTFLTIWEAQFGDFANGAQIIIDQFISSAEVKWSRMSGLVMLLPHGYEGQGPEHSSARLERFLQLCAQENMQVCNITTPSNLFHVMRRQLKRDFRKPLIIMSPKSLLRHPKVIASMDELKNGEFQEIISDPMVGDIEKIETVILCSGKVYYDIQAEREEKGAGRLCVLRIEQFYPFAKTKLASYLSGYPNLKRVIWAQEEPKNMGGYTFVRPFVEEVLEDIGKAHISVQYIGRIERASPATGQSIVHKKEQAAIVEACMTYV